MISFLQSVWTFYVLQAAHSDSNPCYYKHSHRKWTQDFDALRLSYFTGLADRMHDYLVLASAGEARHGGSKATHRLKDFPDSSFSRHSVYNEACFYTLESLMTALPRLFYEADWESSYGDKSWGDIITAASWRSKMSPEVFIDHVVDLCHNNGTAFNKEEVGLFSTHESTRDIEGFLDFKAAILEPWHILLWNKGFGAAPLLRSIFKRGVVLGILTKNWERIERFAIIDDEVIDYVTSYKPIAWGSKVLSSELIETEYCIDCESDECACDQTLCNCCGEYYSPDLVDCPHCGVNKKAEHCLDCGEYHLDGECDWKEVGYVDYEDTA